MENAVDAASLQHWIDSFNLIYVWALVIGVASAAVVAGTSWKIIKWQGQIQAEKDRYFDTFRLAVAAQVADAKKEGIDAGKAAGGALLKAAEADERAAKLEKEAAGLRLDLAKVKTPLTERRLGSEKAAALTKELTGSGIRIALIAPSPDREINKFAKEFIPALKAAGVLGVIVMGGTIQVNGITAIPNGVNISPTEPEQRAQAKLVEKAFKDAGIEFGTEPVTTAPGTLLFGGHVQVSIGPRPNLPN